MAVSARPAQAFPSVEFDPQLVRKLSQLEEPYYASYPTEDHFSDSFGQNDYVQAVAGARAMGGRHPISLYLYIPFCNSLCHFCSCNRVVVTDRSEAIAYLDYLKLEIDMQGKLFAGMNRVEQLHFGGGTPTCLADDQMDSLLVRLRQWFQFAPDNIGEYSIEIDPRTVTPARIRKLRSQGFNCVSIDVQDFDPGVQKAVNRIQSEGRTLALIEAAREAHFRSVSVSLIYGLPKQTLMTMAQTLSKVIAANPDRIAIYNYAHLPHIFKSQRRIAEAKLPSAETTLDMLFLCVKRLTDAGYVYIGMDHFAKPTDDLAVAQRQGRLHRNFQGYSAHAETDLVACGVSAISTVGATYSQNEKTLDAYYGRVNKNELPIARGIKLTMDDLLRLIIVRTLMCHFELSFSSIELVYPIAFTEYFATELVRLRELEKDGLIKIDGDWLTVTLKGRLLIRNVCMVFDRHPNTRQESSRYSKQI